MSERFLTTANRVPQELSAEHRLLLRALVEDWRTEPTIDRIFEKAEQRADNQFQGVARQLTGHPYIGPTIAYLVAAIGRENDDALDIEILLRHILDELKEYGSR